jgi:hypothetical protein
MKPEGSLPHSQEPSTGPYPQPDRSTPYHPVCLRKIRLSPKRKFTGWYILHKPKKGGRWAKQTQHTQHLDNLFPELFQYERKKFQVNLTVPPLFHSDDEFKPITQRKQQLISKLVWLQLCAHFNYLIIIHITLNLGQIEKNPWFFALPPTLKTLTYKNVLYKICRYNCCIRWT